MLASRMIVLCCTIATVLGGCANMDRKEKGAMAGAAAGGLVGAATNGGKGALIGAGIGALAGGVTGAYLDKRQNELAKVVKTEKTDRGLLVTLKNDLLFDFNKADLKPTSTDTLNEMAKILAKYPKDNLRIAGFTDKVGAENYNKKLSERRAENVRNYLAQNGVTNNISAVGMGEVHEQTNDKTVLAKDRKVEIYIDVAPPPNQAKQ